MTTLKALYLPTLTGLFLLAATAACGQSGAPPSAVRATSSAASGLTLEQFTARRERRMLAADTDGDGRVSRSEFLAAATAGKGDPARRFDRLDRNADGLLDRQEIAALMARRFGRLDTNGDGVLAPTERMAARRKSDQDDPGA